MNEITASRTLVKSPPELWAECSDAESLARHLGEFGEIRITKLEPETAVAWEGEEFSGTVRLEPSGWGTKVVITAQSEVAQTPAPANPVSGPPPPTEMPVAAESFDAPEPSVLAESRRASEPESTPTPAADRGGLLARLFGRLLRPSAAAASPGVPTPPEPPGRTARSETASRSPAPAAAPAELPSEPEQHLHTALESLGQAHRRPFSRG